MTKLLLVLALAFAPFAAAQAPGTCTQESLAMESLDGPAFQGIAILEYRWCCRNPKCWEACAALCECGDPGYCVGGEDHPGSPGSANGNAGFIDDIFEMLGIDDPNAPPSAPASPFSRRERDLKLMEMLDKSEDGRRLQVMTGCGARPALPIPELVLTPWFACLRSFLAGNAASRDHCERTLPRADTCCASVTCGGDPHFQTWVADWFYYHGECDPSLKTASWEGKPTRPL